MFQETREFRPWGIFGQMMVSQRDAEWSLIACCSHEDRCRAIFECMSDLNMSGRQLVFEIKDPPSTATKIIERKTAKNRTFISGLGFYDQVFSIHGLMEPFSKYEKAMRDFLEEVGGRDLIVDITSLPKKIYFFLMKLLFREFDRPRNVLFTYAEPKHYSDKPLAENPDPWEALPGFRLTPRDEVNRKVVVGIGYEPLGLPALVDSGRLDRTLINFMLPFPAQFDRVSRNWRFLRGIFPNTDPGRLSIIRVDGINVPEVFQSLSGIGEYGEQGLILAPFGPKPISLAMAIYAAKHSNTPNQTGVYYTQPNYYNPEYSSDVRKIDGHTALNAYCIKLNGQLVY